MPPDGPTPRYDGPSEFGPLLAFALLMVMLVVAARAGWLT
jgi:hypothetical protein